MPTGLGSRTLERGPGGARSKHPLPSSLLSFSFLSHFKTKRKRVRKCREEGKPTLIKDLLRSEKNWCSTAHSPRPLHAIQVGVLTSFLCRRKGGEPRSACQHPGGRLQGRAPLLSQSFPGTWSSWSGRRSRALLPGGVHSDICIFFLVSLLTPQGPTGLGHPRP